MRTLNKIFHLSAATVLACSMIGMGSLVVAANDTNWDAAVNLYKTGDYSHALPVFQKMAETSSSPSVHYMLGQCYKNLNKLPQAKLELDWVAQYSTDSKTKALAQAALTQMQPNAGAGAPATGGSKNSPPTGIINDSISQTVAFARQNGWRPCPGRCLNYSKSGWQHRDVPGHASTDYWMSYKRDDGGEQSYNQHHIGHIIKESPGQPATDTGPCPLCNGTGWVRIN
jgi:hypothetical protein